MDDVEGFMERHGLAYRPVVIDEWHGSLGVGVFSVAARRRLSPVLADRSAAEGWVRDNAALVAGADMRGIEPPSPHLVKRYQGSIRRALHNLSHLRKETEDSMGLWEARIPRNRAAGVDTSDVEGILERKRRKLADIGGHEAGLRELAERVAADPAGAFLPVGATVRVRRLPTRPYALEGYAMDRPEIGSTGVVIGVPEASAEWGVMVAFEDYRDVSGERWSGRLETPIKFPFDAADLEVLSLGKVLGGCEIRSVEWFPTHKHGDYAEEGEMAVEANGRVWRIHRYHHGGEPWFDIGGRAKPSDLDFLIPLRPAEVEPGPGPSPSGR